MQALFEGCDFARDLRELEGRRVQAKGSTYTVRNFIMGDHMIHMMMYKVAGAHGPSSTAEWRRPCPCCDLNPDGVHSWSVAPSAVLDQPHAEALVGLSRWQVVPDAMHGLSNMVHGVLLKATIEGLQRHGETMAAWSFYGKPPG